ncbi:hypothetical protein [Streptomyces ziwulingensis]|uniref:DUF308 domain-containing protein n=1 Tax=Streptomyces ziwulingensis TaxID=1045501 RepID=A0ABP9CNA9_9ACTN
MAEHDSDREDREERDERQNREGLEQGASQEQSVPFDEEAAWAAIVAGYGDEPPDPPGAKPFKSVDDLALLEAETNDTEAVRTGEAARAADPAPPAAGPAPPAAGPDPSGDGRDGSGDGRDRSGDEPDRFGDAPVPAGPLGSSVVFAPGVGGPRDHSLAEPADDDLDEDDEGHFVPPEPPPLPDGDTTARFAWLGVLGGPVLLLLAVLLGWEMTWWLTTLCVGGFLGGFATLVLRMRDDDEEGDDPGRGAVV